MSVDQAGLRSQINLAELAVRESEQIEWKENVADIESVAKTLCAFANDLANLGGGYVVCGAAERRDRHGFPLLVQTGLTANRLKEVEGKVLQYCRDLVSPPLTPLIEEHETEESERRLLIFIQPSTGTAHTFRHGAEGGKHYVRIGRETREARNGVLRELLVRKGVLDSWDRRICPSATVEDLDLLALRDALQRMRVFSPNRGVEAYLSEDFQLSPLAPSLCIKEPLTGILRPRNFSILLFGREPQRFVPGAYSLFSIYPGSDRSDPHAERHEIAGTIIEQARKIGELLDVQSYTAFDKTDSGSPNSVKYPKRALYETMGNALAHRDYELNDPNRITVFDDRIEVQSPGGLPSGVTLSALRSGTSGARWRNQALAWFFNRLQIAQAEGQGIPTIFRSMREEGCPPPQFDADETRVICVLPAHPRYATLRELRRIEHELALGELPKAKAAVEKLLERDRLNVRALQLFAEIQTALRQPSPVMERVSGDLSTYLSMPGELQLQLGEALLSGENTTELQRTVARRLLQSAAAGRLEERELRRIAVAMLRSREEEAAIELIDRNTRSHPEWEASASLHQLRGDAYIGLAKRCRNAAKRRGVPQATRERSWARFDELVWEAEMNLDRAEGLSLDSGLTTLIRRNRDYLKELKNANQPRNRWHRR